MRAPPQDVDACGARRVAPIGGCGGSGTRRLLVRCWGGMPGKQPTTLHAHALLVLTAAVRCVAAVMLCGRGGMGCMHVACSCCMGTRAPGIPCSAASRLCYWCCYDCRSAPPCVCCPVLNQEICLALTTTAQLSLAKCVATEQYTSRPNIYKVDAMNECVVNVLRTTAHTDSGVGRTSTCTCSPPWTPSLERRRRRVSGLELLQD